MEVKEKKCKREGCNKTFKQYNSLQTHCCYTCQQKDKPAQQNKARQPIPKVSAKQNKLLSQYTKIRKVFLSRPENKYCIITGTSTIEIHHLKGKVGYGDDWAREFNVPLLIDERFFMAVSREGHNKIHSDPEWSYKKGFLIRRNI